MPDLQGRFSLDTKRIMITGATGYLGRAMVMGLAEMGASVILNGRNRQPVELFAAELCKMGFNAEPAVFDVNDGQAVGAWFDQFAHEPLHGLVNNAYAGGSGSVETAEEEEYRHALEVCLVSAHRILRSALPSLRAAVVGSGGASVVNIASMYGLVTPDQKIYEGKQAANPPFYGAAKAALLQWTRYAACEFGAEGIRVNSISPGPFPSDEIRVTNPDFVDTLAKRVPLGRVGCSGEMQGPLTFLISDASTYVNGANLVVDGGWTCW